MKTSCIHALIVLALVLQTGCASTKTVAATEPQVVTAGKESQAPRPTGFPLSGRWEGTDGTGTLGAFIFREDGLAILEMKGERMGDPESDEGKLFRWQLDANQVPMQLDLVNFDRESGEELGRILGIIEQVDATHIRLRTFFNETRPASFEGMTQDDTIELERVGEAR